ncbi:hypothetical protein KKJ09_19450 [Xenorhabdus bovienii]|uniref:hypothetical protein n=1 Tax=Xenorhabdus bovienii TaxID=40576 RepID=UPI0023B33211|nr:hypothetical protein [Xenorhabdus bovienii]MDE9495698.1 hypothetical protein [Xenorhabdus bovienii]MDE9504101.1 hypothetical protein [Xenorhabdus bovienii]MDE9570987.1 hypothetical protein [Xenorhabdus bovienii]
MAVTYKEMHEKMSGIQNEIQKRENFLRKITQKFVNAYKCSLKLENDYWTDIEGKDQPYVLIGDIEEGSFTKKLINDININGNIIKLAIVTVVDDSPRGGSTAGCVVKISTDKYAEEINIEFQTKKGKQEVIIRDDDWRKACEVLADVTYMNISRYEKF